MINKILTGTLLIYSAVLVFVLPYLYSSSSGYAKNPEREVWLSTQVEREEIYRRMSRREELFPIFVNIVNKMYYGNPMRFPENLFRLEDLLQAGVGASPEQAEETCSEARLNDYRGRAKLSLWYTPLVFSPQSYKVQSDFPLVIVPPLMEEYPVMMLFIPRTTATDIINIIRCKQYLVFVPEKKADVLEGASK